VLTGRTVKLELVTSELGGEGGPPIVLIANDQEWSARSLESVLGPHGFACLRAYTARQAVDLAKRMQPDAVIAEALLPDMSGVDLCHCLAEVLEFPGSTPIVLTTAGAASRSDRLEAFRAGAWDYLSLPLDVDALILKLSVYVRGRREIEKSRDKSLLDPVTGLYNLRGLMRRAREIGAEAGRRHSSLACIAVSASQSAVELFASGDLDSDLATQVAAVFQKTLRASDAVGRIGRGEFGIIAPGTDRLGAQRLAERLRETIEGSEFVVEGTRRRLKAKAGYSAVADFAAAPADAVELLLQAGAALRHARTIPAHPALAGFEELPGRLAD
jgi:diguanylate cyclase (GGDEF)-like protein